MNPKGGILTFAWQKKTGWWIIAALCAVPIISWATYVPLSPRLTGWYGSLSALGQIAGLTGIMLYAINLILATRLRLFESLFGGLNRVYIAHHLNGAFALILLSFHPVLLGLRYVTISVQAVFDQILPRVNGLDKQDWAINFGVIAFTGLVTLLIITFFVRLPYRIWFLTHRFLGVFFFFGGLHVLFISSDVAVNRFLRYYILTFVLIGTLAYAYRSLLGRILVRKYRYTVVAAEHAGQGVTSITLEPTGQPLSYDPGQFVFIRILGGQKDGISTEWHPFSLAAAPGGPNVRIAAKALGDYTKALRKLQPGVTAEIEGAYGKFSYVNYKNPKQVWIAGGIGITPFLSMAEALARNDAIEVDIDLFYTVRSKSELIGIKTLQKTVKDLSGSFRLHTHVSEEAGFLTADIIETEAGLKGKDVYVCGPPAMMKAMKSQLVARGVPKSSIRSEEFAMT
jgi:predicted ferric reductase